MPSPTTETILSLNSHLRLVVRRREDEHLDVRLARCAADASPAAPNAWRLTQAGFRVPIARVPELCAALSDAAAGR